MLRKLAAKTRQLIFGKWYPEPSYFPGRYWVERRGKRVNKTTLPFAEAERYAAKLNGEEIKT